MTKKAPKTASKPKATPKPTKPKKCGYVAPLASEWLLKPALLKLRREFGENASVAIHKLQFELRQVKAKLKKCLDVLVVARRHLIEAESSDPVEAEIDALLAGK